MAHVGREPAVRRDSERIEFAQDCNTVTRIDDLTGEETTGRVAFFHGKIMLEFIDDNMVGITKATLFVFEHHDAGSTLDPKISTGVGSKGNIGSGTSLTLNHGVSARTKDTTIRDIHGAASPFLKGSRATVGARAKVEQKRAMHDSEAPIVARKTGHVQERESRVLASFHSCLGFPIAGGVVATSAFHNTLLRSDSDTKLGATPKFTAVVGAPGKSGNAIGFDQIIAKPNPQSDGGIFVAAQEHPGVGSECFHNDKEGLETTHGRDTEESKIHVKARAFDVEKKADTRAIGNGLALRTEANRTIEITGDLNFRRKTFD